MSVLESSTENLVEKLYQGDRGVEYFARQHVLGRYTGLWNGFFWQPYLVVTNFLSP